MRDRLPPLLSPLDFLEGKGGGNTDFRDSCDALYSDAEGALFTYLGRVDGELAVLAGCPLVGSGGSSVSPHAGAFILFSSDFVLVAVTLVVLLSLTVDATEGLRLWSGVSSLLGSGGGCFLDGNGGGPLG